MTLSDVKTVLLPWYTAECFETRAARVSGNPPAAYDAWLQTARAELSRHLAAGYAVEIVSVSPGQFRDWLARTARPDDQSARIDYLLSAAGPSRQTLRAETSGRLGNAH